MIALSSSISPDVQHVSLSDRKPLSSKMVIIGLSGGGGEERGQTDGFVLCGLKTVSTMF